MAKKGEPGVVDQLRSHIRDSGQTLSELGKASGVGKDRLSRFMRGERDLTFSAVEKICQALHLRLVQESDDPKARGRQAKD
jgi:transcriptional regulator with XRE-family HTH domain